MSAALVPLRPEEPSALDIDADLAEAFQRVEDDIAAFKGAIINEVQASRLEAAIASEPDEEELHLRRMVAVMAGEPSPFEGYPAR